MSSSVLLENYLSVVQEHGINTAKDCTFSGTVTFSGTTNLAGVSLVDLTTTGNTTLGNAVSDTTAINGATTITSTSASALTVGRQGATAPVLKIDASTASVATGVSIVGAAAASGVAVAAISSGTDESLTLNAKGAGLLSLGGSSTGLVKIGQGSAKQLIQGGTVTALGATQNSTPTAAQLLGGIVTQQSQTAGGTVTTPTGATLSAAISGIATGDSFRTRFANIGNQTLTITAGASGITIVGTATVATLTNIDLLFVCTGTDTWVCYTNK